jgi:peroxiredoxin
VISRMMNYGLQSQMMGMDALWLGLADRYYFAGKTPWADSTWTENLRKEAKKIRHNLVGMEAHNLIARDSNNRVVQLSELTQDFVLVYFFEPTCGHCKKTTPVLHDSVYSKWKNKGFEVFAFYTQTDRKEWLDFIHKHHLTDWVNVWDPYRESQFWEFYDSSSTPGVYLLDKKKKIIAKKIDTKTLDMILEEELVKRKEKKK